MVDRRVLGVSHTVALRLATLGLGGIVSVLVSRELGPAGLGEYTVLVTIAFLTMAFGHLSVEQGQQYLWPKTSERDSLAANAAVLGFLVGSLAAGGAWLVIQLLGETVVPVASPQLLGVALATVPFAMTILLFSNLLILDNRIRRVNVAQVVAAVVELLVIVSLAVLNRLTVTTVTVVWAATACLPVVFLAVALRVRPAHVSPRLAARTMVAGLRYHISLVFLNLLWWVDILILNSKVSSYQVGLYSVAVTLATLTYIGTDAVSQIMLPQQTMATLRESGLLTIRIVRANVMIGVVSVAAVLLLSLPLIPLLYGRRYEASYPSLLALAPGVLAQAIVRPAGGYLIRLDRPGLVTLATGTAMALNIGLNLLLIPHIGIAGSAVASSVAYVLLAATYLWWVCRSTGVGLAACVPRRSDAIDITRRLSRRLAATSGDRPADSQAAPPDDT